MAVLINGMTSAAIDEHDERIASQQPPIWNLLRSEMYYVVEQIVGFVAPDLQSHRFGNERR